MTDDQFERYKELEKALTDQGILSVDHHDTDFVNKNIEEFLQLLCTIKELGFDATKVLSNYQNMVLLEEKQRMHNAGINQKKSQKIQLANEIAILEQECSSLRQLQEWHNQRLLAFDHLEHIGFGMNDLNLISNTLREIAFENSMSYEQAKVEFFKKIESIYQVRLNDNNAILSRAVRIAMFITKSLNDEDKPRS